LLYRSTEYLRKLFLPGFDIFGLSFALSDLLLAIDDAFKGFDCLD